MFDDMPGDLMAQELCDALRDHCPPGLKFTHQVILMELCATANLHTPSTFNEITKKKVPAIYHARKSIDELVARLRLNERSIRRIIDKLVLQGYIYKLSAGCSFTGKTSIYEIYTREILKMVPQADDLPLYAANPVKPVQASYGQAAIKHTSVLFQKGFRKKLKATNQQRDRTFCPPILPSSIDLTKYNPLKDMNISQATKGAAHEMYVRPKEPPRPGVRLCDHMAKNNLKTIAEVAASCTKPTSIVSNTKVTPTTSSSPGDDYMQKLLSPDSKVRTCNSPEDVGALLCKLANDIRQRAFSG